MTMFTMLSSVRKGSSAGITFTITNPKSANVMLRKIEINSSLMSN